MLRTSSLDLHNPRMLVSSTVCQNSSSCAASSLIPFHLGVAASLAQLHLTHNWSMIAPPNEKTSAAQCFEPIARFCADSPTSIRSGSQPCRWGGPTNPYTVFDCSSKRMKGLTGIQVSISLLCSFEEFDPVPIAAASLAQVHRAVLKSSGQEVAVKVQYPGLQQQFETDISTMHVLSKAIAWVRRSL